MKICCVKRFQRRSFKMAAFRFIASKYIHSSHKYLPTIYRSKELACQSNNFASFFGSNSRRNFCDASAKTILINDVQLSDSCIQRLKEMKLQDESCFLRIEIDGGGCSGFQYKFNIDNVLNDDDGIISRDGVKVVVDTTSLDYIKGSTIDYHEELIRSAFRIIHNPIAEHGCSCGASFSIKI